MANNPILGTCSCPICKAPGAQVLSSSEGKGKPYLKCDECVSIVRTSSAEGARRLLALVEPAKEKPASAESKLAPAPDKPKPAPRSASWLDTLAGVTK